MSFKLKVLIKPLILGCVFAVILMFFEVRYLFSGVDFSQVQLGLIFLLVSQAIFFALVFLVIGLTIKYIKNGLLKGNLLDSMGLGLLFIHLFSFLIAITYMPYLTYLNLLISITLLAIGLILYHRRKNELAVVFILWGIVVFILSLLWTSIGYWS